MGYIPLFFLSRDYEKAALQNKKESLIKYYFYFPLSFYSHLLQVLYFIGLHFYLCLSVFCVESLVHDS